MSANKEVLKISAVILTVVLTVVRIVVVPDFRFDVWSVIYIQLALPLGYAALLPVWSLGKVGYMMFLLGVVLLTLATIAGYFFVLVFDGVEISEDKVGQAILMLSLFFQVVLFSVFLWGLKLYLTWKINN